MKKILFFLSLVFSLNVNGQGMFGSLAADDLEGFQLINTAGITTTSHRDGIMRCNKDFKAYGLWTTITAGYYIAGATSTTQKYNFKDPRDLDAAYRLVFTGGWTHASTGADPNGSTGYADTKLNSSTVLNAASWHLSYYSRENTELALSDEFGNIDGTKYQFLSAGRTSSIAFVEGGGSYTSIATASVNKIGFFEGTRTSSTGSDLFLYRNASSIGSNLTDGGSASLPNYNILLGAGANGGTIANFSNRECAFSSIGAGHSVTQVTNMNAIVARWIVITGR